MIVDPCALTERETEVAALLARGYSNPQIAAELGIARETVKSHVVNILQKLHVKSRYDVRVTMPAAARLSPRQMSVIELWCAGNGRREISKKIGMKRFHVGLEIEYALSLYGVKTRAELQRAIASYQAYVNCSAPRDLNERAYWEARRDRTLAMLPSRKRRMVRRLLGIGK